MTRNISASQQPCKINQCLLRQWQHTKNQKSNTETVTNKH